MLVQASQATLLSHCELIGRTQPLARLATAVGTPLSFDLLPTLMTAPTSSSYRVLHAQTMPCLQHLSAAILRGDKMPCTCEDCCVSTHQASPRGAFNKPTNTAEKVSPSAEQLRYSQAGFQVQHIKQRAWLPHQSAASAASSQQAASGS